jgi:hypothetical protein
MDAFSFVSSLGWYLLVVPLVVLAIGAAILLRGIGHAASGSPGKAGARVAVGAPVAIIGLAFSLLGFNTQTFTRLTYEAPIALVIAKAVDPANQTYDVTVKHLDTTAPAQTCRMQGDEWVMSARVQKWKPWANVMGLDTTYTLDQIDNKYFDAERANGKMITACDLKGPPPAVDSWVPQSWVFWIVSHAYAEDRHFGSAAYMPLTDGAAYRVIITQSGLNAEPANDIARQAHGGEP